MRKLLLTAVSARSHKGDLVYKSGDSPKYVYVVKTGSYETLATYTIKESREHQPESLIGPADGREEYKRCFARLQASKHHPDLKYSIERHTLPV